jgi:spore coat polysaccharide biosynthesis protein SpsF
MIGAVIQARMGSSRLKGKSLKPVLNKPILQHVYDRCKISDQINDIIVATTTHESDDPLIDYCQRNGIKYFRGSENDVLERIYLTALKFDIKTLVRVTADNPLVGFDVIDYMINEHQKHKSEFTSGYHSKTFPNGTVVSIIEHNILEYLNNYVQDPKHREHVITDIELIKKHFVTYFPEAPIQWRRPELRYCIDTESDFQLVKQVMESTCGQGKQPTTSDIITFLDNHDSIKKINYELAKNGY